MSKVVNRRAYTRKDGTKVKATSYYITSQNTKTLKKPNNITLKQFGYTTKVKFLLRKKALDKAIRSKGYIFVINRLNLIRNYSSDPLVQVKLSRDIDYTKVKYIEFKNLRARKGKKKKLKR